MLVETQKPRHLKKLAAAITWGLLSSSLVGAQALEEVVVTAQKREQNLQDVGISITALGGEQLREMGIANTTQITQQVPGLQVNTWSPTITTFNLRGVSQANFTDNLEAPVAVYSDDVYISSLNAISGQLFDVDRVEVLRGPQGTLFGRNATGGLVHYLTRRATDEELNGYIEASSGEFSMTSFEGAVGGAISDSARFRIAGRWEEQDGYIKGSQPGVRGVGGADGFALRGTMQFDLSDAVTADVTVQYTEDNDVPTGAYVLYPTNFDADGNAITDPVTGLGIAAGGETENPFQHDSDFQGSFDREVTSVTGKLSWDVNDSMNLVSITNYFTMDKFYIEDGDAVPLPIITFNTVADVEQFSQELRLSGEADRMRWQVGAYFLDIDQDSQQLVAGEGLLGSATASVLSDFQLDSSNWSLFGQVEYDITDAVTLIGGFRWSEDDKDLTFVNTFEETTDAFPPEVIFDLAAQIAATPGADGLDEIDYGDFAARVQVDWRVSEDTLVFASYNRGIKGGNWTLSQDVELFNIRHDEETLNSFEAGFKTTLAGGLARLNGTAFYYDYDDYQVFSLTNLVPQVNNSDAEIFGGELELFWSPAESWDFIFGVSFLDSDVDEVPTLGVDSGLATVDLISAEMPNAPGYSFNFLGRKTFRFDAGTLAIQLDGIANDDQFLEGHNSSTSRQKAYEVLNARVTFTAPDEQWSVAAWVKNLTDEEYRLYNIDLSILGSTSFYAPPQQAGITASFRW